MKHRPSIRSLLSLLGTLLLAAPAVGQADDLIERSSAWRYLDDGSDAGTSWRGLAFVDSSWALGDAHLGYGDEDEVTEVSYGGNDNQKHITTYFRRTFQVTNPASYQHLVLGYQRDDGIVIYLNGVEVVRDNMPGGTIDFDTEASDSQSGSEEDIWRGAVLDPADLLTGTNVIAAEVHQISPTSSDISFDLELWASAGPVVTRGPYLQLGTPTSIVVRWRTNEDTDGRVRYGLSPGNLTAFADDTDPTPKSLHSVTLSGLAPNTTYYYSVGSSSAPLLGDDADHSFVTAPLAGTHQPVRIWAVGDSGTADLLASRVRDAYESFRGAARTDVWLMLGDNAYDEGTNPEYQSAVFDMYPEELRDRVLWPTRGNHEDFASVYYNLFDMPTAGEAGGLISGTEAYYSFDYANVHFVCLDSEGTPKTPGGAMATWLAADLAATTQDWIIAYWHHPPYTKGSHNSDTETDLVLMRTNILPILEAGGADLVLCGHSHSYERSFQIHGHYGLAASFDPTTMLRDGSSGEASDAVHYVNRPGVTGTVYSVAGSSGKLTAGPLNHPIMMHSILELGSLAIDVDGDRMDVRFIRDDGVIEDHFILRNYPEDGLSADTHALSVTAGGTQSFTLEAGLAHAGRFYWLLGTATGNEPGFALGPAHFPLNYDGPSGFMVFSGIRSNKAPFSNTLALLDASGNGTAGFTIPPGTDPGLIGRSLHFAYAVYDVFPSSVVYASNPATMTFVP